MNYEELLIEKHGISISRVNTAEILNIAIPTLDRYVKLHLIIPVKRAHKVIFTPKEIVRFMDLS